MADLVGHGALRAVNQAVLLDVVVEFRFPDKEADRKPESSSTSSSLRKIDALCGIVSGAFRPEGRR